MTKYPIYLEDGDTIIVSDTIDLHYSPDENAWYFQDYGRNITSVLYDFRDEALSRFAKNNVAMDQVECRLLLSGYLMLPCGRYGRPRQTINNKKVL